MTFQPGMSRRTILKGAAAVTVASPILWRSSSARAATSHPPQWIAFGPKPTRQMWVSWSCGSAKSATAPAAPRIRYGKTASYGTIKPASLTQQVPIPSGPADEPAQHTYYSRILLTGLAPGTTYHYSVSNDGNSWGPDTSFTTATSGTPAFRFTAFGDQAVNTATAGRMATLAAACKPAFHLVSGDLSYATAEPQVYPDTSGYLPTQWDNYLNLIGPAAAQSVPWMTSVGAHEVEPLGDHGYAGFITRFPQNDDSTSGSPVVHTFTYGNVAIIHLDGNDLSGQTTAITGYSGGAQTTWLNQQLAAYRANTEIDFIVAVCNCCCYSSNTTHGSDGGLRDAWGPLFDKHTVDLVISGHVHAYERTNPIRAAMPTRQVPTGGTVHPVTDGTTYICVGGGGNGLYKSWYGSSGGGDGGSSTKPKIWRNGKESTDSVTGYSAYRRAAWHCLQIDVTPTGPDGRTQLLVQALRPEQSTTAVTSIAAPPVMDSITIVRLAD